jgi:NAD(P)-dependent dehydrogenase (short-subunit alcohol dehydrogenase family)
MSKKNIVVVGGGTPNRFGNDFVKKAKEEGHNVIVISHKDHGYDDEDFLWIDFKKQYYNNFDIVIDKIRDRFEKIDIIFFNQNGRFYPSSEDELFSTPNYQPYIEGMNIHVIVPHEILIGLLPNLDDGSKVVFTSSTMAFELNRKNYTAGAGYAGLKGYVNHLMYSLAMHRPKKITFSSIMPHYDYLNPNTYKLQFGTTYNYILEHDDSNNGKIVSQMGNYSEPYAPIALFWGRPL